MNDCSKLPNMAEDVRECRERVLAARAALENARVELCQANEALGIAEEKFTSATWSNYGLAQPWSFGIMGLIVDEEKA